MKKLFIVFSVSVLISCSQKKENIATIHDTLLLAKQSERLMIFERDPLAKDTFVLMHQSIKNAQLNRIFDSLIRIPELKKEAFYIDSMSNSKIQLNAWVYETPEESSSPYYWVKVGAEKSGKFIDVYNFLVNKDSYEVKYYNPNQGEMMTLDDWRVERDK